VLKADVEEKKEKKSIESSSKNIKEELKEGSNKAEEIAGKAGKPEENPQPASKPLYLKILAFVNASFLSKSLSYTFAICINYSYLSFKSEWGSVSFGLTVL